MKQKTKVLIIFICLMSFLLSACDSKYKKQERTIDIHELANCLESGMQNASLLEISSERYLKAKVFDPQAAEDYIVKNALSQVIDEYGVIMCVDTKTADKLCVALNEALDLRRQQWDGRYYNKEKHKIDSAYARKFGRYVIYGVLSPDELEALFKNAEKIIFAE